MTDPVVPVDAIDALPEPVVFADVRWYLEEPEKGMTEYRRGHIPGAVYVHLDDHLSTSEGPGRHPLPDRAEFAARMGRLGMGDEHTVVAYDDRGGAVAARLWWMLRDIGHDRAHVLDGGLQAWIESARPVRGGVEALPETTMTVRSGPTRTTDRTEVRRRLGTITLLDARAPERYRGEEEPIDPVAGHIPTALNADLEQNLGPDLRFHSPDELRRRFEHLGVRPDRDTVVYCGSGVTACHDVLAIVRAGLDEPVLYPGSWSDWSTTGGEVATGPDPGTPAK